MTPLGLVLFFSASSNSEVKLLTLSKDEYEEVKDRFPDARDILNTNVRSLVSLAKDGMYLRLPNKPMGRIQTISPYC